MSDSSARLTWVLNQDWEFHRCDAPDAAAVADAALSPSPCTQGEGRGEGTSVAQPVANLESGQSLRDPHTLSPTLSLCTGRGRQNGNGEPIAWEHVHLPHSVRLDPLNASGGRNFQGVCWYRKRLNIDDACRDRILYLHFEGAMQVADVWLNGERLATHCCGYTPFTIDITKRARVDGENELLVRLDNRDDPQVPPGKPQRQLDFAYFGGLYRNVRLDALDRLHLSDPILANAPASGGIFVTYPQVIEKRAVVRVQAHVLNEHDATKRCVVRHELLDPDGHRAAWSSEVQPIAPGASATFVECMEVADPKLWHPHHPHLYSLRTVVLDDGRVVDEQVTRIGIRHLRFDANEGLFINHEKFRSIGANRHQDHPYVGYALPDSQHYRDVKKLREAGFTSFRSHYPQAPAFMDACDELGMLAIVSNPGWQFDGKGDELFRSRTVQNARDMVRRDRNRPSVILWEAALNETDNSSFAEEFQRVVHEEFPGDQCFTAGDRERKFAEKSIAGWDVEYLHNDGTKPYWVREWGDQVDNWSDQQSSSRVARGWGETPMLVQAWSHLARMDELFVGHMGSSSGENGKRLCGACLWAGIDCQRGYHHQPFYGGVLDLFRLPKFNYYLFASQRPPGVHVPGLDDGPIVFIANFVSFLSPTTVTVFSNCEEVRLLQDGAEVARQKPDQGHRIAHPPFTFRVNAFGKLQTTMHMTPVNVVSANVGELRAEGLIDGKVAATHVVRPPGVATRIELEADLCGRDLVADGSDWIRVYARVCDARGTTCPFADDMVTFDVEGEGSLIGGAEINANPMRAEAGIATALVRSTTCADKITVRASAFDLKPAEIEIVSRPAAPVVRPVSPQPARVHLQDVHRRQRDAVVVE